MYVHRGQMRRTRRRARTEDDAPVALFDRDEGEPAAAPRYLGAVPGQIAAPMEAASGVDLADVRVHRESTEPARFGALAYAQGRDIYLGPGQEGLLAHEAWHVVQQRQGRVGAAGEGFAVDPEMEAEAETVSARIGRTVPWVTTGADAARTAPAAHLGPQSGAGPSGGAPAQPFLPFIAAAAIKSPMLVAGMAALATGTAIAVTGAIQNLPKIDWGDDTDTGEPERPKLDPKLDGLGPAVAATIAAGYLTKEAQAAFHAKVAALAARLAACLATMPANVLEECADEIAEAQAAVGLVLKRCVYWENKLLPKAIFAKIQEAYEIAHERVWQALACLGCLGNSELSSGDVEGGG